MASVQDIKIAEALLVLCLAYYEFDIAEIEALWLSCFKIWGKHFMSIFSIFSILAGWIAEMHFMLFFVYIAV